MADSQGLTLYFRAVARRNGVATATTAPACVTATCMGADWKAVLADNGAQSMGNWTVIANQDGTRQWAFKGKRLYTSVYDGEADDLRGRRHGGDRAWRAMTRSGDCPDLC